MLAHYAKAHGGSSCLIPIVILLAIVISILTDEQNWGFSKLSNFPKVSQALGDGNRFEAVQCGSRAQALLLCCVWSVPQIWLFSEPIGPGLLLLNFHREVSKMVNIHSLWKKSASPQS